MTTIDLILYLSNNPIGDPGATALSRCISKIDSLYITNCEITEQGMKVLAQEIEKRNNSVGFISKQGRIYLMVLWLSARKPRAIFIKIV